MDKFEDLFVKKRVLKFVLASLLFLAVLLSPFLTSYASAPRALASNDTTTTSIIARTEAEEYYLKAINDLRKSHNLPSMVIDSRLSGSATNKGADMSSKNYWGHYAPGGNSFADFIWRDSPKAETVGENLARCFVTRGSAFDALKASPTHFAIMVGNFDNFGVAEVHDKNTGCTNTVMHFALYN